MSNGSLDESNSAKKTRFIQHSFSNGIEPNKLIREKLKLLTEDQADKARLFAYDLISNKKAKGYAATISKHELAKQVLYHAATWKPTHLGNLSTQVGTK